MEENSSELKEVNFGFIKSHEEQVKPRKMKQENYNNNKATAYKFIGGPNKSFFFVRSVQTTKHKISIFFFVGFLGFFFFLVHSLVHINYLQKMNQNYKGNETWQIYPQQNEVRRIKDRRISQKMNPTAKHTNSNLGLALTHQLRNPFHIRTRNPRRVNPAHRVLLTQLGVHSRPQVPPGLHPLHRRLFHQRVLPQIKRAGSAPTRSAGRSGRETKEIGSDQRSAGRSDPRRRRGAAHLHLGQLEVAHGRHEFIHSAEAELRAVRRHWRRVRRRRNRRRRGRIEKTRSMSPGAVTCQHSKTP
ncbi:PREDICTED: uncharacterized protein LOC101299731 [Fragaria vesca subsp. vesca]